MLPACFRSLISVLNEQAARSTGLTEKFAPLYVAQLADCLDSDAVSPIYTTDATFTIEILTGSPPRILNYLEDEYWDEFPDMPAWEFARFERLVRKGQPYMGTMVTIAGGDEVPPEYRTARIAQERYDLERSVRYCREVLGIGE